MSLRRLIAKKRAKRGFTLLEVMIAISIMTVAFSAILTSESGSIHSTIRTKELNRAGWLAQNIMVQSEHLLEGKPFGELEKLKIEKFPSPDERYTWKREIKELKFPELNQSQKDGQPIPEAATILMKTVTKFLSNSIREMAVTVTWQQGTGEQNITLTTYLIDLNAEFNIGGGL